MPRETRRTKVSPNLVEADNFSPSDLVLKGNTPESIPESPICVFAYYSKSPPALSSVSFYNGKKNYQTPLERQSSKPPVLESLKLDNSPQGQTVKNVQKRGKKCNSKSKELKNKSKKQQIKHNKKEKVCIKKVAMHTEPEVKVTDVLVEENKEIAQRKKFFKCRSPGHAKTTLAQNVDVKHILPINMKAASRVVQRKNERSVHPSNKMLVSIENHSVLNHKEEAVDRTSVQKRNNSLEETENSVGKSVVSHIPSRDNSTNAAHVKDKSNPKPQGEQPGQSLKRKRSVSFEKSLPDHLNKRNDNGSEAEKELTSEELKVTEVKESHLKDCRVVLENISIPRSCLTNSKLKNIEAKSSHSNKKVSFNTSLNRTIEATNQWIKNSFFETTENEGCVTEIVPVIVNEPQTLTSANFASTVEANGDNVAVDRSVTEEADRQTDKVNDITCKVIDTIVIPSVNCESERDTSLDIAPIDNENAVPFSSTGIEIPSNSSCVQLSESIIPLEDDLIAGHGPFKVQQKGKRLFPVFYEQQKSDEKEKDGDTHLKTTSSYYKRKGKKVTKNREPDGMEQLMIDAGQKLLGPTQCSVCKMVYHIANEEDEKLHASYHSTFLTQLRFPGWKSEKVVGKFFDGRVLLITKDCQKYKLKKVKEVLSIADLDIGIPSLGMSSKPDTTFLLFITADKKVAGCLVAESITQAYHIDEAVEADRSASLCTGSPVKVLCGINRIWVAPEFRRQNIATRLVDCIRCTFIYGYPIPMDQIAFSDPTSNGRRFAEAYTKTKYFLVYK